MREPGTVFYWCELRRWCTTPRRLYTFWVFGLTSTGDCLILKYFMKSWLYSSKDAIGGSYLSTQAYLIESPPEETTGVEALVNESPLEIGFRLKLSLLVLQMHLHLWESLCQFGRCPKFRTEFTGEVDFKIIIRQLHILYKWLKW